MCRVMRKPVFSVSDQVQHNTTQHKNDLCSENKGVDQLRYYICEKAGFRLMSCVVREPVFRVFNQIRIITQTRPCNIQHYYIT